MPQIRASKWGIHNHQVRRFRHSRRRVSIDLSGFSSPVGPRHQHRLLVQKLQRAQMRYAIRIYPQQTAPDFHIVEPGRGRQQTQSSCRHVRSRQVHIITSQHLLNQSCGQSGIIPQSRVEVPDALGCRHQQGAGTASRVRNPQSGNSRRVVPVAHILSNGKGSQQGSRRRSGVKGAVVPRRIQNGMKDTAQQIVTQAGDIFRHHQSGLCRLSNCAGNSRVGRTRAQGRPTGLKNGLVIQG